MTPRSRDAFAFDNDLVHDYSEASAYDHKQRLAKRRQAKLTRTKEKLRTKAGKSPSRAKAQREPQTSIAKVESDRSRKNSRVKGTRAELDAAGTFSTWCGELVRRTPQSGGWSNSNFGVSADLVCANDAFPFAAEIKHREGWVLDDLVTGARKEHDKSIVQWWLQAVGACPRDKEPLLVFRRNRQPWLVMVRAEDRSYDMSASCLSIMVWVADGMDRDVLVLRLDEFLKHEPVPKGLRNYERSRGVKTHGKTHSRTYKSWEAMIQRCTNNESPSWARYGGRGIKVCARWLRFEKFLVDMKERPLGTTLGRDDNDGNYTPGNCSWRFAGGK